MRATSMIIVPILHSFVITAADIWCPSVRTRSALEYYTGRWGLHRIFPLANFLAGLGCLELFVAGRCSP